MISVSPNTKIFLAVQPIDFRSGIDSIAQLCRTIVKQDPMSGSLFVFRNRNKQALKLLNYDGQGFWLHQKRLSSGKLHWWPSSSESTVSLTVAQLNTLLWNGNPLHADFAQLWRPLQAA